MVNYYNSIGRAVSMRVYYNYKLELSRSSKGKCKGQVPKVNFYYILSDIKVTIAMVLKY